MYEKISDVHVSGHASEEELRYLIRLVKPKIFVPVHGEYRHLLRHAHIAIEEGIPADRVIVARNGDLLELSETGAEILEQLEAGRVFVHGKGVGEIVHDVLRDRRTLSEVGIVVVVLVVEKATARLISGPDLSSKGVTFDEVAPELLDNARSTLAELLALLDPVSVEEWERIKEDIRLCVRRYINKTLGRKPFVHTVIMYI
jgi:ribonuclease J